MGVMWTTMNHLHILSDLKSSKYIFSSAVTCDLKDIFSVLACVICIPNNMQNLISIGVFIFCQQLWSVFSRNNEIQLMLTFSSSYIQDGGIPP